MAGPARYILEPKARILNDAFFVGPTLSDCCFCRIMTCISTSLFPYWIFLVHILLVESPNERENVLFFCWY
jgi:hypothetical protein